MCRLIVSMMLALASLAAAPGGAAAAQALDSSVVSEHVRISIPPERAWLGRDVIMDLERCWRFVNPATGGSLPAASWSKWTGVGQRAHQARGTAPSK